MSKKGFTLLEVMIAMAVLAGALVLLANSWGGATMRVRKAQTSFEIAALLESKMAETEIKYRGGSLEEIPEDPQEFEIDEKFKWRLSSKKLEFPDLTRLFAQGGSTNAMLESLTKQFSDILSKSIKEVTVTLVVTENKKVTEHTVTTYFIDYSKAGGGIGAPGVPGGLGGGGSNGPSPGGQSGGTN